MSEHRVLFKNTKIIIHRRQHVQLKTVIKRGGYEQPFDVAKIKKVIVWATQNTGLNPLELEQVIDGEFRDTETSIDIHNKLIIAANGLVDLKDRDTLKWNIVAGRLKLMDLYKESATIRKHSFLDYDPNFEEFVTEMVESGIYDSRLTEYYTLTELSKAGTFIKQELDMSLTLSQLVTLMGKSLVKYKGKVVELPQERYLMCALMLNLFDKSVDRMDYVKRDYEALASRKISLATPMLAGLGRQGANLASCFIQQPEDSLDGIQYNEAVYGRISKNGGASGWSWHKVRAIGSDVSGYKNASGGLLPWTKILNDKCIAVNQTGKRKGAITPAVPIYHRDIWDFLEVQEEAGDVRNKAYDISPQITIPDYFMKKYENKEDWYVFDPYELKTVLNIELDEVFGTEFEIAYDRCVKAYKDGTISNVRVFNTKELMKKIYVQWHSTGFPTISFTDKMNRDNPNKHIGNIPCSNLCSESFGVVKPSTNFRWEFDYRTNTSTFTHDVGLTHICNLMSINIYNAYDELDDIVPLITRMLDNTIELTEQTNPEAERYNKNLRVIGIGMLGLADIMAKHKISYNKTEQVKAFVNKLFARVAGLAYKTSALLAKDKGQYPYYSGSQFNKGIFLGRKIDDIIAELEEAGNLEEADIWEEVKELNAKYGLRNGSVLSYPPTTTTSLGQGVSAGVTPVYQKAYMDKNMISTSVVVAPEVMTDNVWYYVEQRTLNQAELMTVVGEMQKWVDQAISFELNWDHENKQVKIQDYDDVMMTAWRSGCKTIYYQRHILPNAQKEIEKEVCAGCAG